MADDNSKKPNEENDPFSHIGQSENLDEFDASPAIAQIHKIGRKAHDAKSQRGHLEDEQRLKELKTQLRGLQESAKANPEVANSPDFQAAFDEVKRYIKKLNVRISIRKEARRSNLVSQTTNYVEKTFSDSSVNGQVQDTVTDEGVQKLGIAMAGALSNEQISSKTNNIKAQLRKLENDQIDVVRNKLYDQNLNQKWEGGLYNIDEGFKKRDELVSQLAALKVAGKNQRILGTDALSAQERLIKNYGKATDIVETIETKKELDKDGTLSKTSVELKKQEEEQARALIEAFKELSAIADVNSEAFKEVEKRVKNTSDSLEKTQKAIELVNAGYGKGGNDKTIKGLELVSGVLGPISSAYQSIAITQPLQNIANRAGFASLANQMYDSRKAAISGDMQELLMMSGGAFKAAGETGDKFKSRQNVAIGINAAANTVTGVAGAFKASTGFAVAAETGGLLGSSDFVQGVQQTVNAVGGVASNVSDIATGASAGATALQATGADLALSRQLNYVSGSQLQSFYNYSMGAREAAIAIGGKAGDKFIKSFETTLPDLEANGISPEQFTNLSAIGGAQQGSMFESKQVSLARNLERSGFGSMQENIGRMGRLAAAGGNNPEGNLSSVLETAFSKSLDSSKALNLMVENTSQMAASSIGGQTGAFDTVKGSAAVLANLVDESAPNKEVAIQAAATAAERINEVNSGVSANFADMAGIAAISKLSGVSDKAAVNLKSLTDSDANAIRSEMKTLEKMRQSKDPNASKFEKELADKLQDVYGLGEFASNGKVNLGKLDKGINARQDSITRSAEFQAILNPSMKGYDKWASGKLTYEELTSNPELDALRTGIGEAARRKGLTTKQAFAARTGDEYDSSKGEEKLKEASSGKVEGTKKELDDLAIAKFKEMAKEAKLAADGLGGVTKALMSIQGATKELSEKLNDKTADDFRSAAAKSASDFRISAETFSKGVDKFVEQFGTLRKISGQSVSDSKTEKH